MTKRVSKPSIPEVISCLRTAAPAVLPSMLLCDFGNLSAEVKRLEETGVAALHLDVMDGHFVPNFTYGMTIVSAIRQLTDLVLDVHLMIDDPARYVVEFCEAGADMITFHIEATRQPHDVLDQIHQNGVAAGVALNPGTPLSTIENCAADCDAILCMSVDAGFGGQSFNPIALDKLRNLKDQHGDDLLLEIDGGVNTATIAECSAAGADLFVIGSAIFKQADYKTAIDELIQLALAARI